MRRSLFSRYGAYAAGAAAVGLLALTAACALTSNGGVTTATIDPSKAIAYTGDAVQLAASLNSIPAVQLALGAKESFVSAAIAQAQTDQAALAADVTASGGTVTLSVDSTSFKAAAQTVLADVQKITASLTGLGPLIPGAAGVDLQNGIAGVNTFVTFADGVLMLFGSPSSTGAATFGSVEAAQVVSAQIAAKYSK